MGKSAMQSLVHCSSHMMYHPHTKAVGPFVAHCNTWLRRRDIEEKR